MILHKTTPEGEKYRVKNTDFVVAKSMKKIELTRGFFALIDDEDFERVNNFKWHASCPGRKVYGAMREPKTKKHHYLHRFIMGTPPFARAQVDHINGDGLDNRRCNLRWATHGQNLTNAPSKKNTTSKFRGVFWAAHANMWRARIQDPKTRKPVQLGYFKSEIEAARAYNEAAMRLFGEFARPNDLI